MAPSALSSIHRSGSRPQLDLSKAAIQGNFEEIVPINLLPNHSHMGVDIGGSLIKLVCFSRHEDQSVNDKVEERSGYPILGARLRFAKFETQHINECLYFIYSKQLHRGGRMDSNGWRPDTGANNNAIIKATGRGAYKFADLFKERLGVSIDKEDEMDCLVAGANFLLKAIRYEAFTHVEGQKEFVQTDHNDLFPYLLVNIGSGVSMIKVDGDGQFERVSGTNIGGGTYWALGKLLTKCKSFDELLELSQRGDNRTMDMLVGDIYGGMDYNKIGLSASTIASSFGKAISEKRDLEDYRPEDISLSLLRMISYNIGQITYLSALRFGLKRIFFGGYFIRGHAYAMDTISFAVHFWSKGEAQAMFLQHDGFLGALGAFLSSKKHKHDDLMAQQLVERFPMGAPCTGGKIHGPPLGDLNEKEVKSNLNPRNRILDFSKHLRPELLLQYHKKALPFMSKALTDFNNPQSQLQATQTMLHFFENCDPKACLPDHLTGAVTSLLKCLEFPHALRKNTKLIMGTLAALESIASALQDQFQEYYRGVMDYLEGIVRAAKAEPKHEIVALCIKCITKIWLAVGKETVRGDVDKVVQLVLYLQELQLEMGDPVITEVLQAWGRICKCLGNEFKYSMPSAIPFLLQATQLEPIFSGTEYNHSLTRKRMVNKITACYVLSTCAAELLQHFDIWIDEVGSTLNNLVGYSFEDEVAIAAISAMPAILKSSKAAVEKSPLQWYPKSSFELRCSEAVSALGTVLRKGSKFEIRARILNSLDECLEISGPFLMSENKILDLLGLIIENVRAILPGSGDKLMVGTYENACKCLTTVMKTWKNSSLRVFDQLFPILKPIWEKDKTENERRKALHIFRLVAEQCGVEGFKCCADELSLHLGNACRDEDQPEIPRVVAQAIGIFAEFGGWTFGPLVDDALKALKRVIENEQMREDSLLARDAAVSALGKIFLFQRKRILADHEVVFFTWLDQLPILHDAQEARVTHDHLCSAVELLKKELLKQGHTLTKIIYVYEKVLLADALATEKTKERMNNQLSHFKSQLPTHSLLGSSFP